MGGYTKYHSGCEHMQVECGAIGDKDTPFSFISRVRRSRDGPNTLFADGPNTLFADGPNTLLWCRWVQHPVLVQMGPTPCCGAGGPNTLLWCW